jgi:branched-chain amino acid transport system permease protein
MMDRAADPGAAPLSGATAEGAISECLRASARWRWPETVFWGLTAGAYFAFPQHLPIMNEIAILALFALSLDLILGYAGIVSLGHAAFLGFGAYVAGLFAIHVSADPILGLVLAASASALLGLLTSLLLLRGSDLSRLMITLGVALVLQEVANSFSAVTGGADGLQGISMSPVLGLFAFDLSGTTAAAYSLLVLFILFLLVRRIMHSPFGLSVKAIRENPARAASLGVPVNGRLISIYTIAAAIAGVSGALLAQTTQFVSLDVFDFQRSAGLMLVLIIGGTGYLYGGLAGAAIFKLMQDTLAAITPQYWQFWVGLLLVIFVLAGRERIAEGAAVLRRRLLGRSVEASL